MKTPTNWVSIFLSFFSLLTFSSSGLASRPSDSRNEIKIALIGDTGAGRNFGSVLKMIAAEKANVVMINGDFGYGASPEDWEKRVTSSIDINSISVIGTLGNHDVERNNTNKYIAVLDGFRTANNKLKSACSGRTTVAEGRDITGADEVCTFGNVSVIGSGIGQVLTESYLENRLEQKLSAVPSENWKLVGYHYTLASMNPGIKSDQATHRFFDIIRKHGAIGAQGHTHTAMASCPISSSFLNGNRLPQCHPEFTDPAERFILPGTGIYVDSSLGGKDTRKRKRCKNPNEQGCHHMVDLISEEGYTRTDGVKKTDFNPYGALFIVFNKGGDPSLAQAYYKSIDGQVIFQFNISR